MYKRDILYNRIGPGRGTRLTIIIQLSFCVKQKGTRSGPRQDSSVAYNTRRPFRIERLQLPLSRRVIARRPSANRGRHRAPAVINVQSIMSDRNSSRIIIARRKNNIETVSGHRGGGDGEKEKRIFFKKKKRRKSTLLSILRLAVDKTSGKLPGNVQNRPGLVISLVYYSV